MKKIGLSKWFPASVFSLSFFLCGFLMGGYNLALFSICKEFNLNDTFKGALVALLFVPRLLTPFVINPLAKKISTKQIYVMSSLLFGLGAFVISCSASIFFFVFGLLIVASSYAIIITVVIALEMDVYPKTHSRITSISLGCFSSGAFLSPLFSSLFLNVSGSNWRIIFVFTTLLSIVVSFSILTGNYKKRETVISNTKSTKKAINTLPFLLIVLICFVTFLYNGTEIGIGSFADTFMKKDLLSSPTRAALSISLFYSLMMPSQFITGALYKFKTEILYICIFGVILCSFLLFKSTNSLQALIYIAFCGFFAGPIYPLTTSFVTEVSHSNTVKGSSIVTLFGGFGGMFGAFGMGYISQLFGSTRNSFLLTMVLMFFALLFFLAFNYKYKKTNLS